MTVCAVLTALSASAYGGYGYDDGMSGFAIFTLIVMIVYIILSIVILIRWWGMTNDVKEINERQKNMEAKPKLTYLVATGDKEKAEKLALTMMVDGLWDIYFDNYEFDKGAKMDKFISEKRPLMEKLDITLPEYVQDGQKFIDYINGLTGNKVVYKKIPANPLGNA